MAAGRLSMGPWPGSRSTATLVARMVFFSAVSMLPDADVLGMIRHIPYGAPWGHRGASHSLVAAGLVGLFCGLLARLTRAPAFRVGLLAGLVMATHGALDALTNGGRGVALLWPFSLKRYFFPWHPIPVAPIGAAFFSERGLQVAARELVYFFPLIVYAFWPRRLTPGSKNVL